jgi:hypothetical protein
MKKTAGITDQLENLPIDSPVLPKRRDQWHSLSSIVRAALSQSLTRYALLVLLMACTLLALFTTSLRPTDVTIQGMGNGTQPITLPLEEHSEWSGQTYVLTGLFSYGLFSQHIIHIVPDSCIQSFQINGTSVNLQAIIRGNLCDSTNGFDIDLKSYLQNGTNHFQIGLIDYGRDGWFGLNITHSTYDCQYLVLLEMLLLEVGALLYCFLKNQLQLPRGVVIIILLGLLLHLLYLSYTPYNVRTYDVMFYGGHFDYIKYVATYWRLPAPNLDAGWEYHQAPLYYISAAIIHKLCSIFNINYLSSLQVLSLLYSIVFLIFGVLTLQLLCKKKWQFLTSVALLSVWPSGIIHAIRIGNDAMYSMICVIAMYFLMRWLIDKQNRHFYLAALFTALTIATKISGTLMIALFAICFVATWLKSKQKRSYVLKTVFFISVLLLASYFSLWRNFTISLHDPHFNIVNGYSPYTMNSNLSVGNALHNYISFNLHTYITQPFTSTWDDTDGRQYFANFFLKSMLFGEFSFPSPTAEFLAKLMSALLLLMVAFSFIGIVRNIVKPNAPNLVMLLWLMLSLLSLLYFRHTYPFSPHQDFRFIFPSIIPFIYFYLTGIEFFITCKFMILGSLAYIFAFLFILATTLFFIIPQGM